MKYVLVLDVAKGKSMFMLSSNIGDVLIDSKINELTIKDSLIVVMEATSIYHKVYERFFK